MPVALLSPPPQKSRTRASSTNLRPASVCHALGRRRSGSFLCPNEPAALPLVQPPPQPDPPPTMLAWFVSRSVQWLHLPEKHTLAWSAPSSPRSSSDEFILPLSASANHVSFSVPELAKPKPAPAWRCALHAPIVLVVLLFPISTALVLWCLSTLPISLAWPHDITDLAQLGRELHAYTQSGLAPLSHVVGVMAISAVWKHAWSIPGSVLWNVLGGALFSPLYATVLLTALTTVGSLCASLLSAPLGPFLAKIFPRALDMTRNALGGDSDADSANSDARPKSPAWVRLSVLRLIGVVPWSGINIACGVCGVSLVDCMLGTFIGCLPWTAVTCQIGDILQTVASSPNGTSRTVSSLLTTPEIILKLVFLSVLSLAPILGRRHLRSLISHQPGSDHQSAKDSRWTWVQDWRTKLATRSRSRERNGDQAILTMLVDEKRRLERSDDS